MCVTGPIQLQMPVVERACEVSRGADRVELLRFACQFMEFGGWVFQDAADLTYAMQWTNRALDYALELGDQRVIAYTLMRKAMIATEGGNPALGLGIASSALERKEALTPRLRAVILPAVLFERGPGGSHRNGQGLRGSRHRGCHGRNARRGRPRALLHTELCGDGSRSILGSPRSS
jgi:hypothetical protein